MPGQQSQMRRDAACMQRIVMKGEQTRLMAYRPTALPRSPAQIDILVVEKEARIESAQLAQHLTAHQQTATRDPVNLLARTRQVVLPPSPWQQQPGEGAEKRRE